MIVTKELSSPIKLDPVVSQNLLRFESYETVRRQLYVLPPGTVQNALGIQICNDENFNAVPIEQVVKLLPTVHKISVLIRRMGPEFAMNALFPLDEVLLDSLIAFQTEVEALTDGVITSYGLNPYRVLCMRLFAAFDRSARYIESCMKRGSIALFSNVNYSNYQKILDSQKDAICKFYLGVELSISFNDGNSFELLLKPIEVFFQSVLEGIKPSQDKRMSADIKWVLKILTILVQVSKHPLTHLPVMLTPLQTLPVICDDRSDINFLSPQAIPWLHDFVLAFKVLSEHFLKGLEKDFTKGSSKAFKKQLESFKSELTLINKNNLNLSREIESVLILLHDFEKLSLEEQTKNIGRLKELRPLIRSIGSSLEDRKQKYIALLNCFQEMLALKKLSQEPLDNLGARFNQSIQYSYIYLQHFLGSIHQYIVNSYVVLEEFHVNIKQILPEKYFTLKHVFLIDLIDFNLRSHFKECENLLKSDEGLSKVIYDVETLFEIIFDAMRDYYSIHKFSPIQNSVQTFENALYLQMLQMIASKIKSLPQNAKVSKVESLLELYEKTHALMCSALNSMRWPKLFFSSPFGQLEADEQLERQFFHEMQLLIQSTFLDFHDLASSLDSLSKVLKEKNSDLQGFNLLSQEILQLLNEGQITFKESIKLNNFEQTASDFWKHMSKLGLKLDALNQLLEITLYDNPDEELAKIIENGKSIKESFDVKVFSLGKPIVTFLNRSNLFKTKETKKKSSGRINVRPAFQKPMILEPPKTIETAPTLKQKNEAPKSLADKIALFQGIVYLLAKHSLGFTIESQDPRLHKMQKLQEASSFHLLESLPALRELMTNLENYGQRPAFIHALYLKLSTAMEQAGILATSYLKIYQDPEDKDHLLLKNMGRECFWQKHLPLHFAKAIEKYCLSKDKFLLFNKEQREFMAKLGRVIAVTSRQPASGNDELTFILAEAFQQKVEIGQVQSKLHKGLDICLALLKPVQPSGEGDPDFPISHNLVKASLSLLKPTDDMDLQWKDDAQDVIQSLRSRIVYLQEYLAFPHNRYVPAIDAFDQSFGKRQGTIMGALNDLTINIDLMEDILSFPEDPSFCLNLTEGIFLHQAAILEQALLVLLSHLPCRASKNSSTHYLWQERNGRPVRYTHEIKDFAKNLQGFLEQADVQRNEEFYLALKTHSEEWVHYLKTAYRYYQPNTVCPKTTLRNHLKMLSQLRDRLIKGTASKLERDEIDLQLGSNDSNRIDKLNKYISLLLIAKIKLPAIDVLRIAEELLKIYEENIFAHKA